MSKVLRLLLLSLLIVLFVTSFVYAGTLTVNKINVSKEIAEAINYPVTFFNLVPVIQQYEVGNNAGNPFVEYSLSAGEWAFGISLNNLQLCRGTNLLNSQPPTLTNGNRKLTFPAAGINLAVGEQIQLRKRVLFLDCQALAPNDIQIINIPQGTYEVGLTVNILNILNQPIDMDSKLIVDATKYEYEASITEQANASINYEACTLPPGAPFANLYEGGTCSLGDTVRATLTRTDYDYDTMNLPTTTKDLTFTLNPSVQTGITSITPPGGWSCTNLVCTLSNNNLNIITAIYPFSINVDGTTVLSDRTFTADLQINYDGLSNYQRFLFQNADAGAWNYRGTSIKVPFIFVNTAQGKNTYIILQSKSNIATNRVWALILASDGSIVTAQLGDMTPGTPFIIAGDTLATAVTAAGKTVGDRFAAIINVAAPGEDIFAYANVIEPDKARFVPLEVLAP